jgi:HEAT repeat protein
MGGPRSTALALAGIPVAFAATQGALGDEKKLEEAREEIRRAREETVRRGATICLEVDSAPAVDVLLEVLSGTQPHFRDIAWEVFPRFRDPYAQQRVAHELQTNKRDARVRQWCAEALGEFGNASFGGALEGALADKEDFVRRAAVKAIGEIPYAPAARKIEKFVRSKDFMLRTFAVEALARIDPDKYQKTFLEGLEDDDPGVRCALLGVVPALYPDRAEETSVRFLNDEDWRPRIQAVDNLTEIRTKTAVDALVRASGDGRPVVAHRARRRLQEISSLKFTLREEWDRWWQEHRENFEFPEGRAQQEVEEASPTAVTYNKLRVVSDHVAFVIDKSAGMSYSTSAAILKDQRAHEELDRTLSILQGKDFVFNVHTFGSRFRTFAPKPVQLDEKSQKAVLRFVSGVTPDGNKSIWEVLETVVADPELDTAYLLSSGEPEVGLYVHWNRVTRYLEELNRFHKVVVHTVAYSDSEWYREQLLKIAEATGGEFAWEE